MRQVTKFKKSHSFCEEYFLNLGKESLFLKASVFKLIGFRDSIDNT